MRISSGKSAKWKIFFIILLFRIMRPSSHDPPYTQAIREKPKARSCHKYACSIVSEECRGGGVKGVRACGFVGDKGEPRFHSLGKEASANLLYLTHSVGISLGGTYFYPYISDSLQPSKINQRYRCRATSIQTLLELVLYIIPFTRPT